MLLPFNTSRVMTPQYVNGVCFTDLYFVGVWYGVDKAKPPTLAHCVVVEWRLGLLLLSLFCFLSHILLILTVTTA